MSDASMAIARPLAHRGARDVALAAVFAGAIAGMALLAYAMVGFGIAGASPLAPLHLAAGVFASSWTQGGLGAALVGFVLHLIVSMVFGLGFAAMAGNAGARSAVGWGVAYGAAVALLMRFIVAPMVVPEIVRATAAWPFLIGHLVFGALLGLTAPMGRALTAQRERSRHRALGRLPLTR